MMSRAIKCVVLVITVAFAFAAMTSRSLAAETSEKAITKDGAVKLKTDDSVHSR